MDGLLDEGTAAPKAEGGTLNELHIRSFENHPKEKHEC